MAHLVDPWGSELVADYDRIVHEFGLEMFAAPGPFPSPNKLMRRGVVFAGRDLQRIAKCIKEKKPFYALSGIMPSGERLHLGNKMVVENLKYFQDHGAQTYILVADLEAAAARGISLEEARTRAMAFHIPAYLALGLDPHKTTFYFQSDNKQVMHLAYEFSKKITLNEFRAVYGSADPSRIMSALTQVGDILFPQMDKRMPGIIPVGIDQDPHIRLARDVVNRTKTTHKFVPPSAIYHKYTPSLTGEIKMSKSVPSGNIELPDDIKTVVQKIKRAKTGGRTSEEEQRKMGGEPEKCMVFEMYKQHLVDEDEELARIFNRCKTGELLCGADKSHCCGHMSDFLEEFASRMTEARKQAKKIKFVKFS